MSILNDVLTLAKAGYKASEIRDLLKEQPEPEPVPLPEPIQEVKPEDLKPEIAEDVPTPAKATGQTGNDVVEELKATIKELQQANIHQDISGNVKDPQEDLNELVRAYM